jgi:GMP synthase-like glutamine amidotransferase
VKVQVLQHVPFEGLGSIETWLREHKACIATTRLFADEPLPAVEGLDLVIVLGGPMSANDEKRYPWLMREKAFLRSVIANDVPLLGICLGAQLIASALGQRVFANTQPEIGWFPIEMEPAGPQDYCFPSPLSVFHWHGESFDLPVGARRLARSAACENQAFQLGRKVIGLQFHLETTAQSAEQIMAHSHADLIDAPWVQSAPRMRTAPPAAYAQINAVMADVLSYLSA